MEIIIKIENMIVSLKSMVHIYAYYDKNDGRAGLQFINKNNITFDIPFSEERHCENGNLFGDWMIDYIFRQLKNESIKTLPLFINFDDEVLLKDFAQWSEDYKGDDLDA